MIFIFFIIAHLYCSVNFLLHSKVTQSHIHLYILFSHIIMLHHKWPDNSFQCYTAGSHCLSIPKAIICSQHNYLALLMLSIYLFIFFLRLHDENSKKLVLLNCLEEQGFNACWLIIIATMIVVTPTEARRIVPHGAILWILNRTKEKFISTWNMKGVSERNNLDLVLFP